MAYRIPTRTVVDEIKSTAMTAFKTYRDMSDGAGLGTAPESFLQHQIAVSLWKKEVFPWVTTEDTLKNVYDNRKNPVDGRKIRGSKSGRFDVLCWGDHEAPALAIEIKKCWEVEACDKDAKRLAKWVTAGGLDMGMIVAYQQAWKRETIVDRLEGVRSCIRQAIQPHKCALRSTASHVAGPHRVSDEGYRDWWWSIACLLIENDKSG